tara:strand:- start:457 stop:744 length:288 start_codon:yes stop_codon:yes gene_type:complete
MEFSLPTVDQTTEEHNIELLVILMEECAEVQQACSKILRYGDSISSINSLTKELGDLQCMIDLAQAHLVNPTKVHDAVCHKRKKLLKWSNIRLCN